MKVAGKTLFLFGLLLWINAEGLLAACASGFGTSYRHVAKWEGDSSGLDADISFVPFSSLKSRLPKHLLAFADMTPWFVKDTLHGFKSVLYHAVKLNTKGFEDRQKQLTHLIEDSYIFINHPDCSDEYVTALINFADQLNAQLATPLTLKSIALQILFANSSNRLVSLEVHEGFCDFKPLSDREVVELFASDSWQQELRSVVLQGLHADELLNPDEGIRREDSQSGWLEYFGGSWYRSYVQAREHVQQSVHFLNQALQYDGSQLCHDSQFLREEAQLHLKREFYQVAAVANNH